MEIPENGFYYHYKHNGAKEFNHHAYEVMGIGIHSEDKSLFVIYRPLYEISDLSPTTLFVRPLEMFFQSVSLNGLTTTRFTKITDPELLAKLTEIRDKMYT